MARLKSVTVKFFGKTFTENLSCDFKEGFCAVFGESGSGKTTLCHIFAGLIPIEGGEVYIGDEEVGELRVKRRSVSLISAETPLRFRTVRENLLYPLRLRKITDSGKFPELPIGFAEKTIYSLSEEEKAEVFFLRALAKNPNLILVDEPSSVMGQAGARRLIELCKGVDKNVIWFTSDMDEIRAIDGNTKIIRKGRVLFEGSLEQLMKRPPDSYTAMLAGYNILEGRAVPCDAFFRGNKKITVEINAVEKAMDGFWLYCHHDGLPLRIFSTIEMSGRIEVCYDEEASLPL